MIVFLHGPMGSGKTTAAVHWAVKDFKEHGRPILSNVHLTCEYQPFHLDSFLENVVGKAISNLTFVFDEAQQLMDSRSSPSKLNKLLSYFIVQTRKRGVNMLVCSQFREQVDLRVRRSTDVSGACFYREVPCPKCKGRGVSREELCQECRGYGKLGWVDVKLHRRGLGLRDMHYVIFSNDVWPYFDTTQLPVFLEGQVQLGREYQEVFG